MGRRCALLAVFIASLSTIVSTNPLKGPTTTFVGRNARNVDVAYNWSLGEFLLVFSAERDADPTKREIRVMRFNAAGVPLSSAAVISSGPRDALPKVAYNLESDRYLVVWQRELFVGVKVYGRFIASDGSPLAGEFQVNAQNTYARRPDVAARNFFTTRDLSDTTRFLVVWRDSTNGQEFHVERARISGDGSSILRSQLGLSFFEFDPEQIDQSAAYDPRLDRFFVAWSVREQTRGKSVAAATGEHGQEVLISSSLGTHPEVAVDTKWWFVCADFHAAFLHPAYTPPVAGEISGVLNNCAVTTSGGGFLVAAEFNDGQRSLHFSYYADRTFFPIPTVENDNTSDFATVRPAVATNQYGFTFAAYERCFIPGLITCPDDSPTQEIRVALVFGSFAHFVHGSGGDFDGDGGVDLFAYRPSTGVWRVKTSSGESSYALGKAGDIPILMDIDNNGTAELGVFRPSNGTWYLRPEFNSREPIAIAWGRAGDIPVPGDYVGDSTDDQAVFRPSTSTWYIRDGATGETRSRQWGEIGDVPVPADYDGDGKLDLCVWRQGNWLKIRVDGSHQGNVFGWGERGDIPLQGNFVGSAQADYVFYRPDTQEFFVRNGATGATTTATFNNALSHIAVIPMPVDWDEDGKLNLAVWDPDTSTWFIRQGTNTFGIALGSPGDIPAAGGEELRRRGP